MLAIGCLIKALLLCLALRILRENVSDTWKWDKGMYSIVVWAVYIVCGF